ncbi:MAG: aminotransferase class I/II-fold pyridoxal phosphate-dependent enzyme [Candidatus Zixiibacteriota bacterium]
MKKKKNYAFSTLVLHGVKAQHFPEGAAAEPIFQTSTFVFKDSAEVKKYQEGKTDKYLYTRYGNPTLKMAEDKMAVLEGAEAGLVVSSGMAAVSTTILNVCKAGDEVISTEPIYGGTLHLFKELFPDLGIKVNFIDPLKFDGVEKLITNNTKILFGETPTNPNLKIVDLKKLLNIARKHKLTSVIDNTFATPYNQNPIKMGADVVIHSATKYLGGHSDLVAGIIVGKKRFIKDAVETMKMLGGCLDPLGAFLLLRGLKTLAVRVEKQNENGMKVARFLPSHPEVKKVYYPGLPSHPQHKLAKSQMRGFGGMVCFDVGDLKSATKVMDSLQLFLNATSLGGVESLASIPVLTSHYGFKPEDLRRADVTPGMIRLSCGIEDSNDLIEDINQALDKIK